MKIAVSLAILTALLIPVASPAAQEPELLSRSVLFSNPDRLSVKISPDGKYLSWLAPVEGVSNIWVAPSDRLDEAKPATNDRSRGITNYQWSNLTNVLLYSQDTGGDENPHVYTVNVQTGKLRDLSPYPNTSASIMKVSERHVGQVLVSMNDRDKAFRDVYRIDLATGERTLVQKNSRFSHFSADEDLKLRLAMKPGLNGGAEWHIPNGKGDWKLVEVIPAEDIYKTSHLTYSDDGKTQYIIDSRGRNTAALYAVHTETGERNLLLEDPRADISNVMFDKDGHAQTAKINYLRAQWASIGGRYTSDLKALKKLGSGEFSIVSRSSDDSKWIVAYWAAEIPISYYLYDRNGNGPGTLAKLFESHPSLAGKSLAPMHSLEIRSRDGLNLVSYLTLPTGSDVDGDGRPEQPVPLILFVHGGPWARDEYGFSPTYQWLANRGYAVLNVNYRGSTGFGKSFLSKGDGEFAGKMHDDLLDAVEWATREGITTPDQVAIMGLSYGGYAALVGLTFTPTTFKCGVDIVGPSSLQTLIESFPPHTSHYLEGTWYKRVGDPRTEAGRNLLAERSPINKVGNIVRPLLVGHGANDPRVKQAESDVLVAEMQRRNIPVTYALFPDEGHGFARPENNIAFNAVVEGFLGECLGGRVEPIGEDLKGSSLQVPVGADQIKGLPEALKSHKADSKQ